MFASKSKFPVDFNTFNKKRANQLQNTNKTIKSFTIKRFKWK